MTDRLTYALTQPAPPWLLPLQKLLARFPSALLLSLCARGSCLGQVPEELRHQMSAVWFAEPVADLPASDAGLSVSQMLTQVQLLVRGELAARLFAGRPGLAGLWVAADSGDRVAAVTIALIQHHRPPE